jgi:hypothetical protein
MPSLPYESLWEREEILEGVTDQPPSLQLNWPSHTTPCQNALRYRVYWQYDHIHVNIDISQVLNILPSDRKPSLTLSRHSPDLQHLLAQRDDLHATFSITTLQRVLQTPIHKRRLIVVLPHFTIIVPPSSTLYTHVLLTIPRRQ